MMISRRFMAAISLLNIVAVISFLGVTPLCIAFENAEKAGGRPVVEKSTPARKMIVGGDVKITGTVSDNITEYAPVDGPAYLIVRSDDGERIRVTYSPGEAECRNMDAATLGFSLKAGVRVERLLLPAEIDDMRETIESSGLINLRSKQPPGPGLASYRVSLSLDGKENTVYCVIPSSSVRALTNCQEQIDKLRLKLNKMLGENIY